MMSAPTGSSRSVTGGLPVANELNRMKDVLSQMGAQLGMGQTLSVGKVWKRWPEIVGEDIAQHAEPTSLRDGVLRVRADSPAWTTEIGYLADEIRTRVNEATGSDLVTEVRVWNGPGPVTRNKAGGRGSEQRPPRPVKAVTEDPLEALEDARKAWLEKGR